MNDAQYYQIQYLSDTRKKLRNLILNADSLADIPEAALQLITDRLPSLVNNYHEYQGIIKTTVDAIIKNLKDQLEAMDIEFNSINCDVKPFEKDMIEKIKNGNS